MRKIFTLVIITLCNLTLYSQTIIGTITDTYNNEKLIGVNIILENGGGTSTDVFGKYTLNSSEGMQKITFKSFVLISINFFTSKFFSITDH